MESQATKSNPQNESNEPRNKEGLLFADIINKHPIRTIIGVSIASIAFIISVYEVTVLNKHRVFEDHLTFTIAEKDKTILDLKQVVEKQEQIGQECGDSFQEEKVYTLQNTWHLYTIDLTKADLSNITGAFGFTIESKAQSGPVTFYLDDVQFE